MQRTINHHALREIRELAGLNRSQLAEMAKISQPYYSEIEAGKKNPSPPVVRRLADALQVNVLSLFCAVPQVTSKRVRVG